MRTGIQVAFGYDLYKAPEQRVKGRNLTVSEKTDTYKDI